MHSNRCKESLKLQFGTQSQLASLKCQRFGKANGQLKLKLPRRSCLMNPCLNTPARIKNCNARRAITKRVKRGEA